MAKRKKYIIGIDIGGTKMLAGLLDKRFKVVADTKEKVDASKGAKYFLKTIQKCVEQVLDEKKASLKDVACIGVGCPGIIDVKKGHISISPNITFLNNYSLGPKLRGLFHRPVTLENDVNAGLYGEYRLGAARGYRHVVGIFPGTGVGGALILDGKLYRGASGAAGEIGHTFMDFRAPLSGAGSQGTLENLTGRLAITAEAATYAYRQEARKLFQIAGTDISRMKSKALVNSIKLGDKAIERLVRYRAKILGISMANVVNLLNPELIILGGGLIEALGNIIVKEAKETMQRFALKPLVKGVEVKAATLQDYAIVKGAAALAVDAKEKRS